MVIIKLVVDFLSWLLLVLETFFYYLFLELYLYLSHINLYFLFNGLLLPGLKRMMQNGDVLFLAHFFRFFKRQMLVNFHLNLFIRIVIKFQLEKEV